MNMIEEVNMLYGLNCEVFMTIWQAKLKSRLDFIS